MTNRFPLIFLFFIFFANIVLAKNPYKVIIGTQWNAANNYVTACLNNCGTCCITNFDIQENGDKSAGANVYFHQNSLSRCNAPNIGPFSMNFLSITGKTVVYGRIPGGPDTKAELQFFSNAVGVTFNDTSGSMCTETLYIVGTYPSISISHYFAYKIVRDIILVTLLMIN